MNRTGILVPVPAIVCFWIFRGSSKRSCGRGRPAIIRFRPQAIFLRCTTGGIEIGGSIPANTYNYFHNISALLAVGCISPAGPANRRSCYACSPAISVGSGWLVSMFRVTNGGTQMGCKQRRWSRLYLITGLRCLPQVLLLCRRCRSRFYGWRQQWPAPPMFVTLHWDGYDRAVLMVVALHQQGSRYC